MKNRFIYRIVLTLLVSLFAISTGIQSLSAQETKKNTVRLKANYVKIMDGDSYLDIAASSRIDKKNTKVSDIDLTIFNILDNENIELGSVITDKKGQGKFVINDLNAVSSDSTNTFNLLVSFKGNEGFKKARRNISFKDALIETDLITKDSINYIKASLIDAVTGMPVADATLNARVQRLFKPLPLGKDFYTTDENGTIIVPVEEGIPGVDGNLDLEVVLDDSDAYGTVKAVVTAPLGVPIVDESTFDKRTMWSPRNKTPLFLLIFPNLIIFAIWAILVYLMINLIRISKSS